MKKTHEDFLKEMSIKRPEIEVIGNYVHVFEKIKFRCKKDGTIFEATPDKMLQGKYCPTCYIEHLKTLPKKKKHENYVEECKIKNPNIEVIGTYTGVNNILKFKCKKCNGYFERPAKKTLEGSGCPICNGNIVYEGINDVATTMPSIVKFFKDKNDAKIFTKGSSKSTIFKCPDCGYEKSEKINAVCQKGYFSCPNCSDGISYPNKFSRALLNVLPVENVEYEYSPGWAKPYRYDNYFEYNGKSYILEMDGGFHFVKCYKSNLSLEETKQNDLLKDNLASEHNITMIRIDCKQSKKEYIAKNIQDSLLGTIFDLSNVDWNYCDIKASKSLIKQVCDYYNSFEKIKLKEVAKHFDITPTTVSNYLKRGTEMGFCYYDRKYKKPIILKSENTSIYFSSLKECSEYMTNILNQNITTCKIKGIINRKELFQGYLLEYAS